MASLPADLGLSLLHRATAQFVGDLLCQVMVMQLGRWATRFGGSDRTFSQSLFLRPEVPQAQLATDRTWQGPSAAKGFWKSRGERVPQL